MRRARLQGYFGGWTDLLFQRFIEIWTSVPTLYLLIIVAAVITPDFWILLGILLAFSWVALVGVVRAEFLRARNLEYVTAARALGLSNGKIIFKPSAAERHGGDADLRAVHPERLDHHADLARLSRLRAAAGLAVARRAAGSKARTIFRRHGSALTAFFVIAIMLSLLIFIGEAVRDALDPRKTMA